MIMYKLGYKAFRVYKKGKLRFLFHTYKGSSLVPTHCWIEAEVKLVSNRGTYKKTPNKFWSGFHYFVNKEDAEKFNVLTKGKYLILPVYVSGTWRKPRSRVGSRLAKELWVSYRGDLR